MIGKVLISVEGQTEEAFINNVLSPYFEGRLILVPILLKTRWLTGRTANKGGYLTYGRIRREILNLLRDSSALAVTTMYDFYALPHDFPGYKTLPPGSGTTRVAHLENSLQEDINHPRFHPYLQLHEFEALVFVEPEKIVEVLGGSEEQLAKLRKIRDAVSSPEKIDDGKSTAPSKRLLTICPGYQKVLHGPMITTQVGLKKLSAACPHFRQWFTWLDDLATQVASIVLHGGGG